VVTGGDPLYPVYSYRVAILASFALAAALTYALVRRLGAPRSAGLVLAVQFAFCCFNRLHVPHLNHISAAFLLPAAALCVLRLYDRPSAGRAAALGAVLAAGVYFSELIVFAYVGLPVMILLALASPSLRAALGERAPSLGVRGALGFALAFLLVLAPFLWNWAADAGLSPQPRQASLWSANLAAFLVPDPEATPLYGRLFASASAGLKGIGGHEAFVGFPLLLLAVAGAGRRPRGWPAVAAGLAALFLVLSLGPTLKVGPLATDLPLPYALLMRVPPFDAGRTPVRCVLLGLFFLTLLAVAGWHRLLGAVRRRWGPRAAGAAAVALLAWAALEVRQPVPPAAPYRVPEELARLVPGPVINVPPSFMDGWAVFLQTLHGQPIVTGFVSRRTPEQLAHVRELDRLFHEDVPALLRHLQRLQVTNVVLGPGTPPEAAEQILAGPLNVVDLRGTPARPLR
jgi:hypothetical protein